MAFIETVEPATGRRESLWVMLSIALILLLGAVGLHFNSHTTPHAVSTKGPELTPPQRQLVMELSIALPEIQFELEASGLLPTVAELTELGIAPFYSELDQPWAWQQLQDNCYMASPQQPAQGHFLLLPRESAIYIATETPHAATSCTPEHEWLPVTGLSNSATRNTP